MAWSDNVSQLEESAILQRSDIGVEVKSLLVLCCLKAPPYVIQIWGSLCASFVAFVAKRAPPATFGSQSEPTGLESENLTDTFRPRLRR